MPRSLRLTRASQKTRTLPQLRAVLGISQLELAGACGIDQSMLSRYENGLDIPKEVAQKIIAELKTFARTHNIPNRSKLYGITPGDLQRPWVETRDRLDLHGGVHDTGRTVYSGVGT